MKHIVAKADDRIDALVRNVCHFFRTHKDVRVVDAYDVNMSINFSSLSPTKRKSFERDLQGFMRIMDIMYDYDMVSGSALDNYIKVLACIKGNLERAEEE